MAGIANEPEGPTVVDPSAIGVEWISVVMMVPTGTFSFDISLNVVLMAVIGGAGTWQGPLIGTPIVLLVADLLRVTFTSEVNRVIFSLVVILIALFIPGGVMGVLQRWRRRRHRTERSGNAS